MLQTFLDHAEKRPIQQLSDDGTDSIFRNLKEVSNDSCFLAIVLTLRLGPQEETAEAKDTEEKGRTFFCRQLNESKDHTSSNCRRIVPQ